MLKKNESPFIFQYNKREAEAEIARHLCEQFLNDIILFLQLARLV
jgi:hypothetical protein